MICNGPKRIITGHSGVGLLQMVSKPDTEWCASEGAGPQGEWIVRSHISWREERNTRYNYVETFL